MTKALGMTVYFRDHASDYFTAVCATSVDGGGVEASMETLEPCLDDPIVYEYPADPKFAQMTIEYKKDETCDTNNVFSKLEDSCFATELIDVSLKIPLPTPCWATRQAYIMSQIDMAKERNQDMKTSIVLLPQTNWEYSTNAPDIGS